MQEEEEKREIKENAQVFTVGNWIDGDTFYQDRGKGGRTALRWKMMGLGLGLGCFEAYKGHSDGDDL